MRKSFVSKDKENTRYWFFFCMKNLTPRRLNVWRLLRSNSRPFGSKLCSNAPPKCQMWSSARGLPRKGMLKLRRDGRFTELFFTVRVIVTASSGLSVWTVTVPLLFLLGAGGVGNWSCCNKLTLCQHTKLMHTYYCTCVTTRTRSECNIPINCRCLMCVSLLQYTRVL